MSGIFSQCRLTGEHFLPGRKYSLDSNFLWAGS